MMTDDTLRFRLLDEYQRDFPLVARPFAQLAEALDADEDAVIAAAATLRRDGLISRLGAVFSPRRIGASTLAALRVPPARLAKVAELVSRFAEVNHNYEREHAYNLWFVATAPSAPALATVLERIERGTGLPMLRLPLEEEFHLDLGFRLHRGARTAVTDGRSAGPSAGGPAAALASQAVAADGASSAAAPRPPVVAVPPPKVQAPEGARSEVPSPEEPSHSVPPARLPAHTATLPLDAAERRLLVALQEGLAFCRTPFAALAERAALGEDGVLARLAGWQAGGVIRRFGFIVRHHELGYRANAMLVHDLPDDQVSAIGRRLAGEAAVTLCYRRPRVLPDWPYNLFCMIHGRERHAVEATIAALRARHGLFDFPHAVLFSRTRYKQQGARYA